MHSVNWRNNAECCYRLPQSAQEMNSSRVPQQIGISSKTTVHEILGQYLKMTSYKTQIVKKLNDRDKDGPVDFLSSKEFFRSC